MPIAGTGKVGVKRFACLMLLLAVCTACAPGLGGEGAFASQVAATIFAEETAARSPGSPATPLRSAQPLASWTPSEQGSASAPSPAPTHAPSLEGTPVPSPSTLLAVMNVGEMVELARWGKGAVYQTVVSPDGTWYAHATSLGVYVHDSADGTQRHHFESQAACRSLAACPDGECLVYVCDDHEMRVVSVSDGTQIAAMETAAWDGAPLAFRFSADGARMFAWAVDRYGLAVESAGLEGWSTETWEELPGLDLPGSRITDVQVDRRGVLAALSMSEGQVQVYDLETGERLRVFSSSMNSGPPIGVSPEGDLVAVGSGSSVELWGVHDGLHKASLDSEDCYISVLRFSRDGRRLALGGTRWLGERDNGFVALWTVEGERVQELVAHPSMVKQLEFSPGGNWLATTSSEGVIRAWNVGSGGLTAGLEMNAIGESTLALLGDETGIAAATPGGGISLWSLPQGQHSWSYPDFAGPGPLSDLALSPDGKRVATASEDGRLYLWNVGTGSRVLTLEHNVETFGTLGVEFNPDGATLVSVGDSIRQWSLPDGELLRQVSLAPRDPSPAQILESFQWTLVPTDAELMILVVHGDTMDLRRGRDLQNVRSLKCVAGTYFGPLALSPDSGVIASWAPEGSPSCGDRPADLSLWDAGNGALLHNTSLSMETSPWQILFSPDGAVLAAMGSSGVELRSATDLSFVRYLSSEADESELTRMTFSPDGRLVAAGMTDGRIVVWDASTGEVLITLTGHAQRVSGVVFVPDGSLLATSSEDGTLRLWGIP